MSHAYADSFFQDCPDQNIDAMWAAYADSCRIEELESENIKLRELVKNLRRVIPADVVGVVIDANTDRPSYYKFDKAFRELGIEVDE